MNFQSQGLALLEASLIRPLALLAVAWIILRLFRVRHPASRHAVWTSVLVGMLLLPIVSVVTPHWTLAVLPEKHEAAAPSAPAQSRTEAAGVAVTDAPAGAVALPILASPSPAGFGWPSPETLIVWCYLVGLLVMVTYRVIGWILLRRVVSRSRLLRPIRLRESGDVVTPVAVGVLRPFVILPAGWRDWTAQTRRAVLAHEFAHLRRGDTIVAALARFVKCVFWFHPVAWWVSRQTSDLAELACDVVALERTGDPVGYSRVLLEFAVSVKRSGQRVAWPGLAMASGSRVSDRVDQVLEMSGGTMRKLARPRVWLAVIGLPATCLAATMVLGAQAAQTLAMSPKFDVVSIKPCLPEGPPTGRGGGSMRLSVTPGFVHWGCVSLSQLVDQAWGGGAFPNNSLLNTIVVPPGSRPDLPKRIRGGPSWVESDKFEIEVKLSGDTTDLTGSARHDVVFQAMVPALQAMLADRFQLKLRKVTEQVPMYAMSVAKGGLKIPRCWERDPKVPPAQATPPPGFEGTQPCEHIGGIGQISSDTNPKPEDIRSRISGGLKNGNKVSDFTTTNLQELAAYLSKTMDRYVLDKTGVEDRFTFKLEYAADDTTPADLQWIQQTKDRAAAFRAREGLPEPERVRPDGPTIFRALEALGLKLDPTTGPAEYLQIDSVQKPRPDSPSEVVEPPARAKGAGKR